MRRKIWEDMDIQCSIIGTCLGIGELRKIARQTKLQLEPKSNEFEIHATFVRLCSQNGPVAKAVNKALDRKYATPIKRFSKASTDAELKALWEESRNKGDIPGPYWALMTHPDASADLRREIFGDVHMLSHIVGSSNRVDIRRLTELESELSRMHERHAKTRSVYRKRLKDVTDYNRTMTKQLASMAKETETLRYKAREHCNELVYRENQSLQRSLAAQSALLADEQARNDALQRKFEAFTSRMEHLEEELREKQAEVDFLEEELERQMEKMHSLRAPCNAGTCTAGTPGGCLGGCEDAGTPDCPGPDLCGKRILYVGGRANLVQHYRNVVEQRGGEFIHHDGGVEQARQALPKLLNAVDAVLCPVDCVSHDACQCVKEVCKHTMKPCKLLRSSGLSSLVRSLGELIATPQTERRS